MPESIITYCKHKINKQYSLTNCVHMHSSGKVCVPVVYHTGAKGCLERRYHTEGHDKASVFNSLGMRNGLGDVMMKAAEFPFKQQFASCLTAMTYWDTWWNWVILNKICFTSVYPAVTSQHLKQVYWNRAKQHNTPFQQEISSPEHYVTLNKLSETKGTFQSDIQAIGYPMQKELYR